MDMRITACVRHAGRAAAWLPAALACLALPALAQAAAAGGHAPTPQCARACLEDLVSRYMEALAVRDPTRLPWAERVRFSENNVMLAVGDGTWNVADAEQKDSRLIFADPEKGTAGYFGVIDQRGQPTYFGLRMKVAGASIAEIEVLTKMPDPKLPLSPAGGDPRSYRHYPQMFATLPPERRTPRLRMIDLANGYFATLQLNDGRLFTHFTDDCRRQENGFESAGNAAWERPEGKLSCGEQFKTGNFIFDCAVRDRDYMVVDEERGLVLARAFIDHCGKLASAKLADGTPIDSWIRKPGSLSMLELFHITAGAIDRIEVVHIDVPYRMPSVWRRDSD